MDRELVVCIGTDIPPISSRELMLLGRMEELISNSNEPDKITTTLSVIFEDFTFSKKSRFEFISSMIKGKFLKRTRINDKESQFEIIPKISYRKSTEMRLYSNLSRRDILSLKKQFAVKK